ncbi:MAG: hypothetical protein HN341_10785 [Verrucomicrobia bacterium]|jgi:hypothetical protein|nr:hypothetical protein [Verrucomicrobiota bacterium]
MKLPADKNERTKILLLIGIGVAAIGYGVYMFGLSPLLAKRKATQARIAELEDLLWKGRKDIDMVPQYLKQNGEVLDQILQVSEVKRQILRPNLGNYLLVAADIIGHNADVLDLNIDSINETSAMNRTGAPNASADTDGPRFKPYTVNVTLTCGLGDLVRLLAALETENPYLCITRLGVIGRSDSPERHAISFDVQWPIWEDNAHPMRLAAERLSDKEKR